MQKATHQIRSSIGGVLFNVRVYGNGRVDFQHMKPGGETVTSRSPSLRDALLMGQWQGAICHCYGRAILESLPEGAKLIDLTAEETLKHAPPASVALQVAIHSGLAWRMQGAYGRSAVDALELGDCMLPSKPTCDAYGNVVPSRYHVKAGTKGSRALVVSTHGEAYANAFEALERQPFTVDHVNAIEG